MLIPSLFFLWAFGVNLNDILIPHLKKSLWPERFPILIYQVAFFGGYFLARLSRRAGDGKNWVQERNSHWLVSLRCGRRAFSTASLRDYGFFLFALFVMACGQSFLEVAANPYVTILGPSQARNGA